MGEALRVLVAEDSEDDALLLVRELSRAGFEVTHERVQTPGEFSDALDRDSWDVVISDYSMPGFSGRGALQLTRQHSPDLPFIFVSGTIGEDVAVSAMKAGAQDYVLKGNLQRLAPAISRELREAAARRERRKADEELRVANELRRAMFDASPLAFISTDLAGWVRGWNDAATRLLGWSADEIIGHANPAIPIGPRGELDELSRRMLRGDAVSGLETRCRRRDGAVIDVEASGTVLRDSSGEPDGFMIVYLDITERKMLDARLRQKQQMEAVGQLAAGTAHDFNNLLTVITSYSDLLLASHDLRDPRREDVQRIREAAEAATTLTQRLLALSRHKIAAPPVEHLNELIENAVLMLKQQLPESVTLQVTLASRDIPIAMDRRELEQVVLALAANSRDAMPDGGRLEIETTEVLIDASKPAGPGGEQPGRYAVIVVKDTGTGMDDETRSHAFDPFFTTKTAGRGSGLGMTIAHRLVSKAGGFILVDSAPGLGTTVRVLLPKSDSTPEAHEGSDAVSSLPRGTETVLYAEDAKAVRTATMSVLQHLGYTVLAAGDGHGALEQAAAHAGPIHLLVTDVQMPGMGGRELAASLARLRPSARVLFVSGYSDDPIVRDEIAAGNAAFIQKPFSAESLARKIRDVLDGEGRREPARGRTASHPLSS